jgi:hypothetical protein
MARREVHRHERSEQPRYFQEVVAIGLSCGNIMQFVSILNTGNQPYLSPSQEFDSVAAVPESWLLL